MFEQLKVMGCDPYLNSRLLIQKPAAVPQHALTRSEEKRILNRYTHSYYNPQDQTQIRLDSPRWAHGVNSVLAFPRTVRPSSSARRARGWVSRFPQLIISLSAATNASFSSGVPKLNRT